MLWLLWTARAALACTPSASVYGFDAWVDGAVDVPTDARIVVLADMAAPMTLTRLDTGDVLSATAEGNVRAGSDLPRVPYRPDAELAPNVQYRADVTDYAGDVTSATFTTGAGPTDTQISAPVLTDLVTDAWTELTTGYDYSCASPLVVRTATAEADVPDGLPPGTYLALRVGPSTAAPEHLTDPLDGELSWTQQEDRDHPESARAAHDCVTPVLILANGAEVAGDEACAPELELGACGTTGGPAGGLGALALAAVATRRRRLTPG